jgi:RimJ/RimL family protein N-acetyltransferase
MRVEIVPANIRDLSYVASNMRASDREEVEAQLDRWNAAEIAAMSCRDYAFCALLDGNPESGFGAGRVREGYWIAWSWSTRRGWKCLPAVIPFIKNHLQPAVYAAGARRVEARALGSHKQAVRFLERIGGTFRCELPGYGKNGETFLLFDWVRETYVPVSKRTIDASAGRCAAHAAA